MSNNTICDQNVLNPVSPLQTGHYMPGLLNIRDYADPAPASGLMVLRYNTYQYGDKFYGDYGQEIKQITGPNGNPVNLIQMWMAILILLWIYGHRKEKYWAQLILEVFPFQLLL